MTKAPEPGDKLNAATHVVVNEPEDALFDWHAVDWRRVEDVVRRLRQRIFTASKAGDLKKVRSLQKLMLRSRANTLLSVRRVTERNAGRMTAGVDGEVVLTPQAKARLADRVHQTLLDHARLQPLRDHPPGATTSDGGKIRGHQGGGKEPDTTPTACLTGVRSCRAGAPLARAPQPTGYRAAGTV
jgi:N-terminal domain of reverse transcriptase